ncbi:hypothetical protein N9137_00845 [Pseudomonadales bacterium]|nr:hypothetical protein [Pseudomonadales bacterium]
MPYATTQLDGLGDAKNGYVHNTYDEAYDVGVAMALEYSQEINAEWVEFKEKQEELKQQCSDSLKSN